MELSKAKIKHLFEGLENGNAAQFFNDVAENVNWTVEGTHPLAGTYDSKETLKKEPSPD